METEGKVVYLRDSAAVIEVKRKGACGDHCAHCSGCELKSILVDAAYNNPLQIGDWVILKSDQKAILLGLFLLFILPLLFPMLVFGLTIRTGYGWVFALIAFIFSIGLVLILNKSKWYMNYSKPYVTEIIKKGE